MASTEGRLMTASLARNDSLKVLDSDTICLLHSSCVSSNSGCEGTFEICTWTSIVFSLVEIICFSTPEGSTSSKCMEGGFIDSVCDSLGASSPERKLLSSSKDVTASVDLQRLSKLEFRITAGAHVTSSTPIVAIAVASLLIGIPELIGSTVPI